MWLLMRLTREKPIKKETEESKIIVLLILKYNNKVTNTK